MAAHKCAVLLKVRSSLGEKEAEDGKRHVASRYIPWFRVEDLAKDPSATLKQLFKDFQAAQAAKSISGTTTDGEVVEERPFNTTGTGKNGGAPSFELVEKMIGRGFTLVNQQEMHEVLAARYGKKDKKTAATPQGGEEEAI